MIHWSILLVFDLINPPTTYGVLSLRKRAQRLCVIVFHRLKFLIHSFPPFRKSNSLVKENWLYACRSKLNALIYTTKHNCLLAISEKQASALDDLKDASSTDPELHVVKFLCWWRINWWWQRNQWWLLREITGGAWDFAIGRRSKKRRFSDKKEEKESTEASKRNFNDTILRLDGLEWENDSTCINNVMSLIIYKTGYLTTIIESVNVQLSMVTNC